MKRKDFDWLTDEFMLYCRSTQLREKTMSSYEQTLHLFGRWCADELKIYTVDKITENVIRKYIDDLQTRGKYTFYVNDLSKKKNYPDRRRDYRKPVSVATINNYIQEVDRKTQAHTLLFAAEHSEVLLSIGFHVDLGKLCAALSRLVQHFHTFHAIQSIGDRGVLLSVPCKHIIAPN